MFYAAFNSNSYLHHIALNTTRPLELAKFYEKALSIKRKPIKGGWVLSGARRKVLILSSKQNSLGFAGFACQDSLSFNVLKRNFMEKGIKTFQDDKSLFNHDNFYIFDCDGNKIYFGLAKTKRDQISNLYAPLQHITFTSENLDNFVDFYVNKLGFKISDKVINKKGQLTTCFMRSNQEHHTVACFLSDKSGLDHYSFEAGTWEWIKNWCDHFSKQGIQLIWGPGRHGPGNNLFVFINDLDGNKIEISAELEVVHDRQIKKWPHEPKTLNLWGNAIMRS
jgi:catechol 2,3-dioxygenase